MNDIIEENWRTGSGVNWINNLGITGLKWESYEDCFGRGTDHYDVDLHGHVKAKLEKKPFGSIYGELKTDEDLYDHLWELLNRTWYGLMIAQYRLPPDPNVDEWISKFGKKAAKIYVDSVKFGMKYNKITKIKGYNYEPF